MDGTLLNAASLAVREGRSRSISEWVGEAMAQRRDRDARLAALSRLITEHEAEHGFITDDEIADQAQRDRDTAGSFRSATRRV